MPRIEMRAQHDHLIRFVGAGNLSNDVERIEVIGVELVVDIHLDSDRNLFLDHSPNPAVVFDGHHDLRRDGWISHIPAAATLNKNRTAASLAGFNSRNYTFLEEELEATF